MLNESGTSGSEALRWDWTLSTQPSHACNGILTLLVVFMVLVVALLSVSNSGQDERGVISHLKRSRKDATNFEAQAAASANSNSVFCTSNLHAIFFDSNNFPPSCAAPTA